MTRECSQRSTNIPGVDSPGGGASHAKRKRGRPSKAEQQARRGRSMGRYPLMAAAEVYLKKRELQVGPNTIANERRIVRFFVGEIEQMREHGKITTTNPKEFGPTEVRAFVDWLRDPKIHRSGRSLDPDTQVRYLTKLEGILEMNGNRVIHRMREEGYSMPRKAGRKPIRAISKPDLEGIQASASKVRSCRYEPEGWRRAKSLLLTTIYVATGLRPSELRLAHREDLDINRWRLYVRSPKGAGVWGQNRTVAIMPTYRQAVLTYLEGREELLQYHGREQATFLIPNVRNGRDGPYSSNHFRELKKEIEDLSGISFKLKDFRPTFATTSVEIDPNLLVDVSAQLGHANIATTQRYYAQISSESAGSRLERAWGAKAEADTISNSDQSKEQLMKILGITQEDLLTVLTSKLQGLPNPRIENKPVYIS